MREDNMSATGETWDSGQMRNFFLRSLVDAVEPMLESQDRESGQFGTKPWICNDQNILLPLAAAWSIEDIANPWFHNDGLLSAIAGGGEALVDAQDENGAWIFRKKDNSTWGQVHQPWTYSRWIRAYALVGEALAEPAKTRWEEGFRRGFNRIRDRADSNVGNMTAHNMMAMYIAGICFENEDWKSAAAGYLRRVVEEQEEGGYWSEHCGPLIGYNAVYVELLGLYYYFSQDAVVLEALKKAAAFHADVLLPDGTSNVGVDERQLYHNRVHIGNVGFTWSDEGRGYIGEQVWRSTGGGSQLVDADYAANMLLYAGNGPASPLSSTADESTTVISTVNSATKRIKPWQFTFTAFPCRPPRIRWVQDRQNLIDVYHDDLGLVAGGGNTKLQPLWSTFAVGDTDLLKHTLGDEDPDLVPDIDLLWTPDLGSINLEPRALRMALKYGPEDLNRQIGHGPYRVRAEVGDDVHTLTLSFRAPIGRNACAHLPLLYRGDQLVCTDGRRVALTEKPIDLGAADIGGYFVYEGLKISFASLMRLRWPVLPHNPYKFDGSAELESGKLVVVMPFDDTDSYTITLSRV